MGLDRARPLDPGPPHRTLSTILRFIRKRPDLTASTFPSLPHRLSPRRAIAALAADRAALAWTATAVFVLCLLVRSPDLFRHPRFWAEEGNLYYKSMRDLPVLRALGFVANGNYQFLTNLFVELAVLSPPRQAAVPTTYLPLLVAALGCFLMARLLVSAGCSALPVILGAALFALQTGGYEVFLSATNVQWVCSVVTLLLALQEDVAASGAAAWGRYGLLAACGFTGTPSCMLLPLFVGMAWHRPSRYRFALAAILAVAVAVQVGVILTHAGQVHRAFAVTPAIAIAFAIQTVLVGALPVEAMNDVAIPLRDQAAHWVGTAAQLVLVGCAGLGILATLGLDRLGPRRVATLVAAALGIGVLNAFATLGRADDLVSGWAGARYFFLPTTCLIVLLASGLGAGATAMRVVAGLLAVVALGNAAVSVVDSGWTGLFVSGPSVSAGVDRCRAAGPCRVPVGPNGFGLTVDMLVGSRSRPSATTP